MDGRRRCGIASYTGGAASYDMSKVDRIMLRFRPIAPKPAAAGGSTPENSYSTTQVKTGRGKRRYVRSVNRNNKRGKKRKSSPACSKLLLSPSGGSVSGGDSVMTLSLLPETPDRKDSPSKCNNFDLLVLTKQQRTRVNNNNNNSPIWLGFNNNHVISEDQTVVMNATSQVVVSWVTVECVTDTWLNGDGLGWTDKERIVNMERDACPGFISDGGDRVVWTNKAYREMATAAGGGGGGEEMVVWLVRKEWVALPGNFPAFTCKVRVTCGKERLTVPCDVWRMGSGGGFAWRLDVKTALCLGR